MGSTVQVESMAMERGEDGDDGGVAIPLFSDVIW
jgi:hypothetical protein